MNIPSVTTIPVSRAESPAIPLPINGLNIAERVQEAIQVNVRDGKSGWDRLHKYFTANDMMNHAGEWILADPPELPKLGKAQFRRLATILKKPYNVVLKPEFGAPLTAKVPLGKLIQSLGYAEVDLIGSGVDWVLGEEYFRTFLKDLKVPDELITDDLFEDMRELPQDFDFRFYAPDADPSNMQAVREPLFAKLAELLDVPVDTVKLACTKKWASRPHDPDKLGMVSLEFYHTEDSESADAPKGKAFDIDFIFYLSLQRKHLNKRDALALRFKIPSKGDSSSSSAPAAVPFELVSDMSEIREPLAHYITRLIDADDPDTINHTGLPISLVSTTKGRFPLKSRLLPRLYRQLKVKESLPEDLAKAIETHSKAQPKAILAAAYNAATLLHPDRWNEIQRVIYPPFYAGSSFLERIYQAANAEGGSISIMQDLLSAHAFLGWGQDVAMYDKQERNYFELQSCGSEKSCPLSIYVKNGLAKALNGLAHPEKWKAIGTLSRYWLELASFDGPPLPDDCLKGIQDLLAMKVPAARKLAFVLLLKWHRQHPDDGHIDHLLNAFSSLVEDLPPAELSSLAALLTSTLAEFPGTYPAASMHALHGGIESLCQKVAPSRMDFAATLYRTGDRRLCRSALKMLLDKVKTDESVALALELISADAEKGTAEAVPLFLEFAARPGVSTSQAMPIFLRLLASAQVAGAAPIWEADAIYSFVQTLRAKGFDNVEQQTLESTATALQTIHPGAAQIILNGRRQAKGKMKGREPVTLGQLQAEIQSGGEPFKCRNRFLQHLKGAVDPSDNLPLREIFGLLLEKLEPLQSKDLNPALSLLVTKDVFTLFTDDPSTLLSHYTRLLPTVNPTQTGLKIQACSAAATFLAGIEKPCPKYQEVAMLVGSTLQSIDNQRSLISGSDQTSLAASITAMAPVLHTAGHNDILNNLLTQCQRLHIPVAIDPAIATNLMHGMEKTLAPKNLVELTALEDLHGLLLASLEGKEQEDRLERSSTALVDACLQARSPTRAMVWAKRLRAPSPCIGQLLTKLQEDKLWAQHEELLSQRGEMLCSAKELSEGWHTQAQIAYADEPVKAAAIFREKASLFRQELSGDNLQADVEDLIKRFSATKKIDEKELCLDLLQAYDIPSANLWDTVLLSFTTHADAKRIEKAWAAFTSLNAEEVPYNTRVALLRALCAAGLYDTSLLTCLSEENFKASPFYGKAAKQRSTVRRLLYANATNSLKGEAASELDYDRLNEYRKTYLPTTPENEYIAEWLFSPHPKQVLRGLKRLQEEESNGNTIYLPPSADFFKVISNIPDLDKESALYPYCAKMLTNREYKSLIPEDELAATISKILPAILKTAITERNAKFALIGLNCFEEYKGIIRGSGPHSTCYRRALRALPVLLNSDFSAQVNRVDFERHFKLLFENANTVNTKLPKSKQKRQEEPRTWTYNAHFISALLDVKVTDPAAVNLVLDAIAKRLEWLINNTAGQKEACLETLNEFLYSSLFSFEEGNSARTELEIAHIGAALRLTSLAKNKGMYTGNPSAELQAEIFFNCAVAQTIKPAIYRSYGEAAISVVKRLLANPSYSKLRRAAEINSQITTYIAAFPEAGVHSIRSMIETYTNFTMPPRIKSALMHSLLRDIQNLNKPEQYADKGFPRAQEAQLAWSTNTPMILSEYITALHRCHKKLDVGSRDLLECYYNDAFTAIRMIQENDIAPKELQHAACVLTLEIALAYWKHRKGREDIHLSILGLFNKVGANSDNDGMLTIFQSVYLEKMFDTLFNRMDDVDGEQATYLIADAFVACVRIKALDPLDRLYIDCIERLKDTIQAYSLDACRSNDSLTELLMKLSTIPQDAEGRAEIPVLDEWLVAYKSRQQFSAITNSFIQLLCHVPQ